MSLHPLTLKSIEAEGNLDTDGPDAICGCLAHRPEWVLCNRPWVLCSYHRGFEDALNEVFFPDCIDGGEKP